MGPPHEGSIRRPIAPWANALTTELHLTHKENEATYSETDLSSDSNYDMFADEIPFMGNIMQLFQFESIFTAAEIQAKKT